MGELYFKFGTETAWEFDICGFFAWTHVDSSGKFWLWTAKKLSGWWFGTWIVFSIILGMSSSQLTNSYFSEGLKPPTRRVLFGILVSAICGRLKGFPLGTAAYVIKLTGSTYPLRRKSSKWPEHHRRLRLRFDQGQGSFAELRWGWFDATSTWDGPTSVPKLLAISS